MTEWEKAQNGYLYDANRFIKTGIYDRDKKQKIARRHSVI